MNFKSRYTTTTNGRESLNLFAIIRDAVLSFALLIMIMMFWPFATVPTGNRGVVTRFGKIISVQNEGMTLLLPWEKLALFSIRSATVDVDHADGSTSDIQTVKVSMTVRYAISPNQVSHVYEQYSHDGDISNYIRTATEEVFKAVTARYKATDLITRRATVSADIYASLNKKVEQYGAVVLNIDMRDFSLSESYMRAINDKVTQEQLKLAADNKTQTIIAEQRQNVEIAKASAAVTRTNADADAYAIAADAKAKADALKVQADALAKYGPQILELRRIEVDMEKAKKWDGTLPSHVYGSAPIPFMNVQGAQGAQ